MKKILKKAVAAVTAMALAAGMALVPSTKAMAAEADGTYCVVGDQFGNWTPATAATKYQMSTGENNTETYTFTTAAKTMYNFKLLPVESAATGSWDNEIGNNGGNFSFFATEAIETTITLDVTNKTVTWNNTDKNVTPNPAEAYYVVGTMNEWNPAAADMMEKNDDGTYTITYTKVDVKAQEFKVAQDYPTYGWYSSWGSTGKGSSDNVEITEGIGEDWELMDVTITFNPTKSDDTAISYTVVKAEAEVEVTTSEGDEVTPSEGDETTSSEDETEVSTGEGETEQTTGEDETEQTTAEDETEQTTAAEEEQTTAAEEEQTTAAEEEQTTGEDETDPVPVTQKKAISSCTVTLSATAYTYDGKAKTPAVTVKDGTKVLKANTDYTVAYKNNTKVGTATVTITGKGNYTGTKSVTFKINAAPVKVAQVKSLKQKTSYATTTIKMSWAKVSGATSYEVYRSTSKTKGFKKVATVKTNSLTDKKLKAGTTYYYKVCACNKSVKGAYSSTVKMVTKTATPKVTAKAGKKQIKITWKKVKGAQGYEVSLSTKKNKGFKKIKSAKASATSFTKKGLKKGQTYYVQVKAYNKNAAGKKVYSGTKTVKVKVK